MPPKSKNKLWSSFTGGSDLSKRGQSTGDNDSSNRRKSTGDSDSNFNIQRSSIFSIPTSFANALELELPLQNMNITQGNQKSDSPSVLDSNDESVSMVPQLNQEWTASDRAQRVAENDDLQSLLSAEVKNAGVVTAAGFKAVHQKFLYSDVVDLEMDRTRQAVLNTSRRRPSLLGSLVKSTFSTSARTLATSTSTRSSNSQEMNAMKRSYGSKDSNLAPRRSSQDAPLKQEQRKALLSGIGSTSVCSLGSLLSSSSLNGEEIFDVVDLPRLKSHTGIDTFSPNSSSRFVILTGINFDPCISELDIDPDGDSDNAIKNEQNSSDGDEIKSFSQSSSENSETDKCGWLPFPERKIDGSISYGDEDLLEPWPDAPRSERAHAA